MLLASTCMSQALADPTLLTEKLQANGFSCASEPNGDICAIAKVNALGFKYDQPIAILVPKNVRRPQKLLLQLHGFRGVCEPEDASPKYMADEFQFLEQMKQAQASNSVMIFPMSTGRETTYLSQLVPRFAKFTNWVNAQIQPTSDHWIVSGHSDAGRVISSALANNPSFTKKVDSVILLDATYGIPTHLSQWKNIVNANQDIQIHSVYIRGSATQPGSKLLKSSLPNKAVLEIPSDANSHCKVPTTDFGKLLEQNVNSSVPLPERTGTAR